MPIADFDVRISSRFQCPTPASAAPGRKQAHQLQAAYDVKTPHVRVDCVLGTRGTFLERVDENYYQGHVPDAPVLLGKAQMDVYTQAEQRSGWGRPRLLALGAAAAVGAVLGVAGCGSVLGLSAVLHAIWPATYAALSRLDVVLPLVAWAVAGALFCGVRDFVQWDSAHQTFCALKKMAACAVKMDAGVRRAEEDIASSGLSTFGRNSTNWVLQQAALELDAARERANFGLEAQKAG